MNMRTINILVAFLLMMLLSASCGSSGKDKEAEATTEDEWIILFDGTSTENFRGYNQAEFPEQGWEIVDGTLHCIGSGKGEAGGQGGDIITKQKYGNFELSLEWKISEGGNSGIFYLAQELEGKPIYESAPEMQVLDNERHPDAKLGKDGNRQAGSLYDLIPAVPQNAKPAGEWNEVMIMVYKGTVVHTKFAGLLLCEEDLSAPVGCEVDGDGVLGIRRPCDGINPEWLGNNRRCAAADKNEYGRKR